MITLLSGFCHRNSDNCVPGFLAILLDNLSTLIQYGDNHSQCKYLTYTNQINITDSSRMFENCLFRMADNVYFLISLTLCRLRRGYSSDHELHIYQAHWAIQSLNEILTKY